MIAIDMSRRWIETALALPALALTALVAQGTPRASLPPLPAPQSLPKPGPATGAPYSPQAILPGGVVVPLYAPGSSFLKAERVREAEQYNMSQAVPGRISSIVNIHNPSIEVHPVDRGLNTGAAVILAAGGGAQYSERWRRERRFCAVLL